MNCRKSVDIWRFFLSPSPLRWRNNYYAGVFRMESGCLGVAFESYGRISLYKI